MKLFYSPGACSLSPHIVLREAGLPFQLERVDLATKKMADGGDYRNVNPKGYVPALIIEEGEVLTEGPAIVQYIADRVPERKLAPPNGTLERYRLQEWLNFITSELHQNYGQLFNDKIPPDWRGIVIDTLNRRFEFLNTRLEGRSYLMGDTFTVADAYLYTVLTWSKHLRVDLLGWPLLKEYRMRIGNRPSVQAALAAEGLKSQ